MKESWIQHIDRKEKDPFDTEAFVALMEFAIFAKKSFQYKETDIIINIL